MTLILLEALGAGLLLVLIVWWTMFSGRERGEPVDHVNGEDAPHVPDAQVDSSARAAPTTEKPSS